MKHNSLFTRILVPFLCLSVVMIITSVSFFSVFYGNAIQEKNRKEYETQTEILGTQIDEEYAMMYYVALELISRNEFFDAIKKFHYNSTPDSLYDNYRKVLVSMAAYGFHQSTYDLTYLDTQGYYFNKREALKHSIFINQVDPEELKTYDWIHQLEAGAMEIRLEENSFLQLDSHTLSLGIRIGAPTKTIGYMIAQKKMDTDETFFRKMSGQGAGYGVFSPSGEMLYGNEWFPELPKSVIREITAEGSSSVRDIGGNKYRIFVKVTKDRGLSVVTLFPESMMKEGLWASIMVVVQLAAALFILAAGLIFVFSARISRPILVLTSKIRETTVDNLTEPMEPPLSHGPMEVLYLQEEYFRMRARLHEALKEKVKLVELHEKQRYHLLQYQMNPHFLYNTLNVIGIMGSEQGNQAVSQACGLLARLLRHSLKDYGSGTTFREEFENIETYLKLMKLRFEHKISYEVQYDSELDQFRLPRFTLQPFTENIFEHAFSETHRNITVHIEAVVREHEWRILISDNGQGFEEGKLAQINGWYETFRDRRPERSEELRQVGGIGMKNTLWRLFSFFDGEFHFIAANQEEGGCQIKLYGKLVGGGL